MPEEFSRTTARKRILLPMSPDSYVDVPVVTNISFIDASDRYQETQFTIDNSAQSSRTVHVDALHPTDDAGNVDTSLTLQVERIDEWPVLDATDRAQETQVSLDNVTGSDSNPPHFSTHSRTHILRYTNPDTGDWIDAEIIDQLEVIDGSDRHQETTLVLNNQDEQANSADPDISDTDNGVDPPYRIDPFQNIVNYGASIWLQIGFTLTSSSHNNLCPATGPDPGPNGFNDPYQSFQYLADASCGLNFDTTSVAILKTFGTPTAAVGASYTYGGGGTSTLATFSANQMVGASASEALFTVVTGDLPTGVGLYQDYKHADFRGQTPQPVFNDTLSVTVNGWGYAGDGLDYSVTGPPPVGIMKALVTFNEITIPYPPGATNNNQNIFHFGTSFGSRTFDFSGIAVSFNGEFYDSVATLAPSHGQTIAVLCRKRVPTA